MDVRPPALSTALRLESALLNEETGIRGYGLTGIPEFVTPFRQGLLEQEADTAQLTELLRGDPAGLRDLVAVRDAVGRWQERIARRRAARRAVVPGHRTGSRGQGAFDQVRAASSSRRERRRADRARARDDLMATTALRNWVFGAIAVLIAVLAALVFEGCAAVSARRWNASRPMPHHRRR
ncbi:CHASE3 domain-containing protein [Embleya sp. NPDC127516]|uniref:CHASE3 domain-containing protein n=1 Tax=Embleya sp. NPDC127516 TaxID=3363990 RepID=UPI003824BE7E